MRSYRENLSKPYRRMAFAALDFQGIRVYRSDEGLLSSPQVLELSEFVTLAVSAAARFQDHAGRPAVSRHRLDAR